MSLYVIIAFYTNSLSSNDQVVNFLSVFYFLIVLDGIETQNRVKFAQNIAMNSIYIVILECV